MTDDEYEARVTNGLQAAGIDPNQVTDIQVVHDVNCPGPCRCPIVIFWVDQTGRHQQTEIAA